MARALRGELTMGMSKRFVQHQVEQYATNFARVLSQVPLDEFLSSGALWEYDSPHSGFVAKLIELEKKIDLSSAVWRNERDFADFSNFFMWEVLRSAYAMTLDFHTRKHPKSRWIEKKVGSAKWQLHSALQQHELLGAGGQLTVTEMALLSEQIKMGFAEAWVERGGREVDSAVKILFALLYEDLTDLIDPESLKGYDDEGLPKRTHPFIVTCTMVEVELYTGIPHLVAGRLPLAQVREWDDLDVGSLMLEAVERVVPDINESQAEAEMEAIRSAAMEEASQSLEAWQKIHHRPLVSPFGLSPDEAESWVCKWMLHMGAAGAATTQYVGDGGIDVQADKYIAQVKLYAGSVGIAALREFAGVAFMDPEGRRPLFFTTGRYPNSGPDLADRAGMALFHFDLETGTVTGMNDLGAQYVEFGFLSQL